MAELALPLRRARRAAIALFAIAVAACGVSLVGVGDGNGVDGGVAIDGQAPSSDAPASGDDAGGGDGTVPSDDGGDAGPYATRVKDGLIALYEMQEGSGSVLNDTSGFGTALPATFVVPADVVWVDGGVSSKGTMNFAATTAASKITAAVQVNTEVTIEVWTRFVGAPLVDYARLASIATYGGDSNVAVTSRQTEFYYYLNAGLGQVGSSVPVAPSGIIHLVGTFKSATKTFYVNGASETPQIPSALPPAPTFATWSATHPLTFFNNPARDRTMFPGELHLVALYSRALSAAEVTQNFAAGPNP